MKIVINNQYGGFNLSTEAIKEYLELKGKKAYFYKTNIGDREIKYTKANSGEDGLFIVCFTKDFGKEITQDNVTNEEWKKYSFNSENISRTDKDLIEVVQKLGNRANTMYSTLKIIEIPDDVDWIIEDYDGAEWVAERHRIWE